MNSDYKHCLSVILFPESLNVKKSYSKDKGHIHRCLPVVAA